MSKNSNKKASIYHRINKLKLKAGIPLDQNVDGVLDHFAINRAQKNINEKESLYRNELEAILVFMDSTWDDIKDSSQEKNYKRNISKLYNYANNIKDLAETYNYELMTEFGLSLRNFCERIDAKNENHLKIVQAHLDVMTVAFKHNLKGAMDDTAKELKVILAKAISENS